MPRKTNLERFFDLLWDITTKPYGCWLGGGLMLLALLFAAMTPSLMWPIQYFFLTMATLLLIATAINCWKNHL